MNYPYLHDFILSEGFVASLKPKELKKLRHNFFALPEEVINEALTTFNPFPLELKQFYREIGFGYFHCNKERVNRILDPYSLIQMNRLEDRFMYDIELKRALTEGHLVFFQTYLYQFLTINRETVNGTNAVYYKRQKITDSLSKFLNYYQNNREYLSCEIKYIDEAEIKKGIPQATLRNTFVYKPEDEKTKKAEAPQPKEVSKETVIPQTVTPTPPVNQTQNPNKKKWSPLFEDDDDNWVIG